MSSEREVIEHKMALEAALTNKDWSRLTDILQVLDDITIPVDVFKSTKIGLLVNRVRKESTESSKERTDAERLLSKWRKLVHSEIEQKKKTDDEGSGASSSAAASPRSQATGSTASSPRSAGAGGGDGGDDVEETYTPLDLSNLGDARARMVRIFFDALKASAPHPNIAESVALEIEDAVDRAIGCTRDNRAYAVRGRLIFSGLKTNQALRESVLRRDVSPSDLARMTDAEFATDAVRVMLAAAVKAREEAREMDWLDKRRGDIIKALGQEECEGEYTCSNPKCRSRKTSYYLMQTRSGDEPMTVFITCHACGKRSRK